MAKEIRARYSQGLIEPLDEVDLIEGEEIRITISRRDEENRAIKASEDTDGGQENLADYAEIRRYIARMRARYGKYARSPEEVRRIVDESMGDKTLTEALYEMREEGL
jgi:predicted DNA-binding antitoxin AbrB/MazE fold protein